MLPERPDWRCHQRRTRRHRLQLSEAPAAVVASANSMAQFVGAGQGGLHTTELAEIPGSFTNPLSRRLRQSKFAQNFTTTESAAASPERLAGICSTARVAALTAYPSAHRARLKKISISRIRHLSSNSPNTTSDDGSRHRSTCTSSCRYRL